MREVAPIGKTFEVAVVVVSGIPELKHVAPEVPAKTVPPVIKPEVTSPVVPRPVVPTVC